MNCWHCNTDLIWGSDFDVCGDCCDGEGIMSHFSCPNELCNASVEGFLPLKEEVDEKKEG